TSPLDVQDTYASYRIPGSECVVMVSGDSWEGQKGFQLGDHAALLDREKAIETYRARHADAIRKTVEEEAAATVPFATFERYFKRHIGLIPRVLRAVFPGIYVFEVPKDERPYWVVDFGRGTVTRESELPERYHIKYQIPAAVLRDCVRRDMWSTFAPSKRYRAFIRKGGLRYRFFFFVTMDLVANGFLPLRDLMNRRALQVLFARRREFYVYLGIAFRMLFHRGAGNRLMALYPRRLDRAS